MSSLEGSMKEWVRKRTTQADSLASDRRPRSESAAARSGFDAHAPGPAFPLPQVEEKEGDIRGQLRRLEVDAKRSAPALVKYPTGSRSAYLNEVFNLPSMRKTQIVFQLAVPLGKRCWP